MFVTIIFNLIIGWEWCQLAEYCSLCQVFVDVSIFGENIFEQDGVVKEEIADNVKSSTRIDYAGNHFETGPGYGGPENEPERT